MDTPKTALSSQTSPQRWGRQALPLDSAQDSQRVGRGRDDAPGTGRVPSRWFPWDATVGAWGLQGDAIAPAAAATACPPLRQVLKANQRAKETGEGVRSSQGVSCRPVPALRCQYHGQRLQTNSKALGCRWLLADLAALWRGWWVKTATCTALLKGLKSFHFPRRLSLQEKSSSSVVNAVCLTDVRYPGVVHLHNLWKFRVEGTWSPLSNLCVWCTIYTMTNIIVYIRGLLADAWLSKISPLYICSFLLNYFVM